MNRLVFDLFHAQPLNGSKYHGGGEYIKAVFKKLALEIGGEFAVFANPNTFLDDWILETIESNNIEMVSVESAEDICSIVNKGRYDVMYTGMPYWVNDNSIRGGVKKIGTVHGLRAMECPSDIHAMHFERGLFRKAKVFAKHALSEAARQRASEKYKACIDALDLVITDSYHSYYSIQGVVGLQKQITMLYPPSKARNDEIVTMPLLADRRHFVLLVGCNRWEKNPYRAMLALDSLLSLKEFEDYVVACVGLESHSSLLRKVRNRDKFVPLGYVEPGELEWLYENCDIFLFPTLNEGFGYPPLEAMAYGTTCVVSAVCSLPDLCGDAVYYINPYNIDEMRSRMLQALDAPKDSGKVARRAELLRRRQDADLEKLVQILCAS